MQIKTNPSMKRRQNGVNILMTALLAAGLSGAALPAAALVTADDTISVRVDKSKLDTEDGVQTVYQTLSSRAEKACQFAGRATLLNKRVSAVCTANLLTEFVTAVDAPLLTAYHQNMRTK